MKKIIIYGTFLFLADILSLTLGFSQRQYTVEKLSFCSNKQNEFSPAFAKDGIIYCTDRRHSFWFSYADTAENSSQPFDLYQVKLTKDFKDFKSIERLNLSTIFNEGPSCLFNSDKSIVFTRNLDASKTFGNYSKSGNTLGIFFAELKKDEWINVTAFEYNSTEYNVMHPTITADGTTMYFASNMPGGIGGYDIYVTHLNNGNWSKPENCGPKVNTDKNEAFPFIHQSGRLYFASKGWNTRGGYDIFFTLKMSGQWIKPENMKEPFSSTADDFGVILDPYLQTGYFASSRNKNDDIFRVQSAISEFENCTQQKKNNFCYVFFENGTSEDDVKGTMKYEWDLGDGTKIRGLEAEHCFVKSGKYRIQLNVIDSVTNEVMMNQAEYDFDVEEIEQPFITAPDMATIGETISFDAKKSNLKNFKIAKYYWDFGDGVKGFGDNISHVFYEEGLYDVKLMLESTQTRAGVKKVCVFRSISIKQQ